jgi:hypothetical protein
MGCDVTICSDYATKDVKQRLSVMTYSKTIRAVCLLSAVLTGATSSGQAQINSCPEGRQGLPTIQFRHLPNTSTSVYSNYYEFWLEWPDPATTCHHNPPGPINPAQNQQPRWVYFWKFGDQTYSTDSRPHHAFRSSDSFDVEVALKPIYSDDHDPFKKPKKRIGVPPPNPPLDSIYKDTVYSMIPNLDSSIQLAANWGASRPTGTLTLAITYRVRSKEPASGEVILLFADGYLVMDTTNGALGEGNRIDIPAGVRTPEKLVGYAWPFSNLSSQSGERTIFVDVRVPDNIARLINETSSVQCPVFASIGHNDGLAGNTPQQGPLNNTGFNTLFGTSSTDGSDGLESLHSTLYNFFEEKSTQVTINWASDPNYILVSPAILAPGSTNQSLRYSIHFQNDGSASATNVDVKVGADPLLAGAGASSTISVPGCFQFTPASDTLLWATKSVGGNICKINGVGDARALGFSEDSTWGQVHYDIQTRSGYVLKIGDTIRAQGKVRMGATTETTAIAVVPVGIPAFCYPGLLGLKYTRHFANDAHRSGWGLALTLRYGLGKVKNPGFEAHTTGLINKKHFPIFWWQGELGYGQTRWLPGTDSFFVRHLDVTPVMLRFIARKPPLRFGNTAVQRGWGFSAGYTSSYLLSSSRNGSDDTAFDQLSFGGRLDHSLSVSADFLNLIGHPGLSFGVGWRWRNSRISGSREWYQNAFVYAHYTFSYRLRKEFGWIN